MTQFEAAAAALKSALAAPVSDGRLTQAELADALSVTPQAVSNWCSGRARPALRYRVEIERLTGVDRSVWLTEDEREVFKGAA